MYFCSNCEEKFEEPNIEWTSYESYYGMGTLEGIHLFKLELCPYCDSDGVIETKEEE